MDFFRDLWGNDFMPHGHCYFWEPGILWTHVLGDGLTALAYFAIPILLIRFIKKRSDAKFRLIFFAFSAFILSCGLVHVFAIISVWNPYYRVEGVLKVITAIVSIATVLLLAKKFPYFLKLPSLEQLSAKNLELVESEEKFKMAMFHAPIGKAILALDGRWLEVNRAVCKMLGYDQDELLNAGFQKFVHPDDLDPIMENLRGLMSGASTTSETEKRYIKKSGEIVWGLHSVSLIRKQSGEPDFFILQLVNITERKEIQDQLKELNAQLENKIKARTLELEAKSQSLELKTQQLEEANGELQSFSYSVSHDLKAPLRALQGFSDALMRKYPSDMDPEAMRWLGFIKDNATRMDRLIRDILDFSRMSRETLSREKGIDVQDIVTKIIGQYPLDEGRTIEWAVDDLHPMNGDPKMLEVIWGNLIGNAIKYTQKQKEAKISIFSTVEDGMIKYTISDNGDGFDPKYADSIFQVFKRLHGDEEFEGTGVGLAIVKRLITKHLGRIEATSEKGKGATFTLYFPN